MAADADAILNTYLPWPAESIARLEKCQIIARYGIGFDNVDLEAARSAGIVVTNVPDYSVEEVAVHTLALILAMVRKLFEAERLVRGGGWAIQSLQPIRRLSEMTFGLFGYGRIARKLAAPIRELGARIIVHDPYLQPGPDLPDAGRPRRSSGGVGRGFDPCPADARDQGHHRDQGDVDHQAGGDARQYLPWPARRPRRR